MVIVASHSSFNSDNFDLKLINFYNWGRTKTEHLLYSLNTLLSSWSGGPGEKINSFDPEDLGSLNMFVDYNLQWVQQLVKRFNFLQVLVNDLEVGNDLFNIDFELTVEHKSLILLFGPANCVPSQ